MTKGGILVNKKRSMEYQLAFQEDYEYLLINYHKLRTYEFGEFAKYWKQWNFNKIFDGTFNAYEIGFYVQLALHCAKKYVIFPTSKFLSVGGLYLLYALYTIQPIKDLCKIRLTSSEIAVFGELVTFLQDNRLLDGLYVLRMLIFSNAFDFVALQLPVEINTPLNRSDMQLINNMFPHRNYSELVDAFIDATNNSAREISALDAEFQRKFKEFQKSRPNLPFIETNTSTSSIVNELHTILDSFTQIRCKHETQHDDDETSTQRRKIIDGAFAQTNFSEYLVKRCRRE